MLQVTSSSVCCISEYFVYIHSCLYSNPPCVPVICMQLVILGTLHLQTLQEQQYSGDTLTSHLTSHLSYLHVLEQYSMISCGLFTDSVVIIVGLLFIGL